MRQILTFCLGDEQMGLDITCVREVLKPRAIQPLPHAPDFIEGVIDLRGHILAVVDLRKKLGVKATKEIPARDLIVCRVKPFVVGLLVDKVNAVLTVADDQIQSQPGIVAMQMPGSHVSAVVREGDKIILILDLEKILTKDETQKLTAAKNTLST